MKTTLLVIAFITLASLSAQAVDAGQFITIKTSTNVDGASFKSGETLPAEIIDRITDTATVTRAGKKYRIPLKFVEVKQLDATAAASAVTIIKAEYGVPGKRNFNVRSRVQELANQAAAGAPASITVSLALLPKQTAKDGRFASDTPITATASGGNIIVSGGQSTPAVLSVTYSKGGQTKTVQGTEGQKIVLE